MIAKKILWRTLALTFAGILIITILCMNELFNGTGLNHPMWDRTYNWFPLLGNIVLVSFLGALISAVTTKDRVERTKQGKTTTKGGYQYGY